LTFQTEQNCSFTFDFSRVYWNSRLSFEHARLVSLFSPSTLVADVFAGVGPFAVPAAKKGVYVLGNDLNPESTGWMEKNRVKNKVGARLMVSCEDGRAFIKGAAERAWGMEWPKEAGEGEGGKRGPRKKKQKTVVEGEAGASSFTASSSTPAPPAPTPPSPPPKQIAHFVMNLPGDALEFLDAFRGSYTSLSKRMKESGDNSEIVMPMVHAHCFSKAETLEGCEEEVCQVRLFSFRSSLGSSTLGLSSLLSCVRFAICASLSVPQKPWAILFPRPTPSTTFTK
jgi:tRNA (guanine37-N1)-methyltransferase